MFCSFVYIMARNCRACLYSQQNKIGNFSNITFVKTYTSLATHFPSCSKVCKSVKFRTFDIHQYSNITVLHKKKFFVNVFQVTILPRRNIHPIVWVIVRPIFKLVAVLTGRSFRKWWKDLPPNKRKYFLNKLRKNRVKIGGVFSVLGLFAFYYYVSHLQETPITKRKRFIAFSSKQFQQIGEVEFKKICHEFERAFLPPNHPATKRVGYVVHRLLKANKDIEEVHGKTWTIVVVDDPTENAFVLPNGEIFVFRGMLKLCSNDDQLGAVLAHEMSHCILAHAAENFSLGHLLDCAMIVVIAMIWAILPSDLLALFIHWLVNQLVSIMLQLPYSRGIETEADEVGLKLSAKACFDVRESSAFWSKMAALKKNRIDIPDVEFLSTHPSHERRSQHLDDLMDEALKLRLKCNCPNLRSPDPRFNIEALSKMIDEERKLYRTRGPVIISMPG